MKYRHTQVGLVIIVLLAVAIVVILLTLLMNIGNIPILVLTELVIVFVAVLALFYSLNIEIKENVLICSFGVGLIRKKIPLSEIREVRKVENPWYAGWGIRWMPGRYWLWNVSGFHAVEIILENGKRFRLGTDEPESLVNAI